MENGARLRASEPGGRKPRQRLHPRSVEVLRRMDMGAALVWDVGDGKYRVNGGKLRRDTVIPRTLRSLLRLRAVCVATGDSRLLISEAGRRLVRRLAASVVDVQGRRVREMGVKTFERREIVQAAVFDGNNFADVDEITGGTGYELKWNATESCIEIHVGEHVARPGEHVFVRDGGEKLSVRPYADFRKDGFKESRA